ncbi:DUF742 domain-containing protein [Micromonospora sp. NPDC049523]|uniref:DUF742 domain-containing protein n=1 Tax=unclassified Micromonospora TaxID=2617518 RepID=UPI002DDC1AD9|nr:MULTISPECIES: DUF742 domain-containing protein [unclassified Micromonospora]WSA87730.1 DUF742 domain-containing protein [Micromonospora sp. NBC_01796]
MDYPPRREDPRGALVRPYAVTRGRTEPRQDIALEAVLTATPAAVAESRFAGHDKHRIATVCEGRAQSLAEIAAYTRLPLGVARVLVADMVADSLLTLHTAAPPEAYEERMELLERVLSGLRRL